MKIRDALAQKRSARARVDFVLAERLLEMTRRLNLPDLVTADQVYEALLASRDDPRVTETVNELWGMWSAWKGAGMDPDRLDAIERVLIEAEATERLARPDELGRIEPTDDQQDSAAEASELLEAAGACVGGLAMSYGFDTPRGRYLGQVSELISSARGALHLLPGISEADDDE